MRKCRDNIPWSPPPPPFPQGLMFSLFTQVQWECCLYIQLNEWMNDFQQLNLVISSNPYFLSVVMSSFLFQNRSSNFPRDTYTQQRQEYINSAKTQYLSVQSRISYLSLLHVARSLCSCQPRRTVISTLKNLICWNNRLGKMPFMYYFFFFFCPSFLLFFYVYTLDGRNFAFMCTHKTTGASGIPALTLYAAVSYDFVGI